MDQLTKIKQILLVLGDVLILYLALGATLLLRYEEVGSYIIGLHLWPFSAIFFFWLIIYYIGGLYDLRTLKNNIDFVKRFGTILLISFVFSLFVFYFIPVGITPRTNLFIFLVIFGLASYSWRTLYNNLLSAGSPANKILLIGYNQTAQQLADQIQQNPQLGYEIKFWMKEGLQDQELEHLAQIILANKINMIVVPAHIKKNIKASRLIYKNLVLGIEVVDLAELYGRVFFKVPLAELEEVWFLENLAKSHKAYEFLKRPVEILIALLVGIITLPLMGIIYLFIKLISRGPVIFNQIRTGQGGKDFIIYKFRTMQLDAEKDGPQWAQKDDKRVMPLGNILRRSHLDELPQLINILRGDLSLVGPRPERPEFIQQLKKDVPYYDLRHIIRPGITGWAQINYRYGASMEDAYEKLQYDIFYIKNRSLVLDILIVIKTLKLLFTSAK